MPRIYELDIRNPRLKDLHHLLTFPRKLIETAQICFFLLWGEDSTSGMTRVLLLFMCLSVFVVFAS